MKKRPSRANQAVSVFVKCKDEFGLPGRLTVGKIYLVLNNVGTQEYLIEDDEGNEKQYLRGRFEETNDISYLIGEKIVCIGGDAGQITVGKEYRILDVEKADGKTFFVVLDDEKQKGSYFPCRFRRKAKEIRGKVTKFMVICMDNFGIADRFDEGGQYEGREDETDFEMFVVKNKNGKEEGCFRDRFQLVNP